MEKVKEEKNIFERLHKMVRQNNLDVNACKTSSEYKPESNSGYWDFYLNYKPVIDLEMRQD